MISSILLLLSIIITYIYNLYIIKLCSKSDLFNIETNDTIVSQFKKYFFNKTKISIYWFFIMIFFIVNVIIADLYIKNQKTACFNNTYNIIMIIFNFHAVINLFLLFRKNKLNLNNYYYLNYILNKIIPIILIISSILKIISCFFLN